MWTILLTILLIIFAAIVVFVILGLLGWGVRQLGFAGSFLGEGIWGCLGCLFKFFFVLLFLYIAFALIF